MRVASWTCFVQVHTHAAPISGEGQASGQAGHNRACLHHRGRRCAAAHVWRRDGASPSGVLAPFMPPSICHKPCFRKVDPACVYIRAPKAFQEANWVYRSIFHQWTAAMPGSSGDKQQRLGLMRYSMLEPSKHRHLGLPQRESLQSAVLALHQEHLAVQVYQLPMESSGSFADLLEALQARSSSLGITHYAMSMPTLEEVFLACTAEPSLPEQGADPGSHQELGHAASPGAVSRALSDCSDGHVAIQMSALNPAAKQGMPQSRSQAAGESSPSPSGSPALHHSMDGSCGAASGSMSDRPEKPSMLGDGVSGSSSESFHVSDTERTSDAGPAAEDQRPGSIDQPRLSISRDDSAQMLWGQPEETCHSQERDKPQRVSDVQLGHESAVPGPGSITSSSRHHEEGEAATHDSYTGKQVQSRTAHGSIHPWVSAAQLR